MLFCAAPCSWDTLSVPLAVSVTLDHTNHGELQPHSRPVCQQGANNSTKQVAALGQMFSTVFL